RMRRALDEYAVGGIKTTLPFFREIVRDEEFINGNLHTGFIEGFHQRRRGESKHSAGIEREAQTEQDIAIIAASLAYVGAQAERRTIHRSEEQSKWKLAGRVAGLNGELRPGKLERP